jgi:hypothetical protein
MFRIVRVPPALDQFFRPLKPHFRWDHWAYFRLLVLVMAFAWGRRNGSNLYRYLDAPQHRTRFNNFFLVQRWDPQAALRQQARELLPALHPQNESPADPGLYVRAPVCLGHPRIPRPCHSLGNPALCEGRAREGVGSLLPEDHRAGGPAYPGVAGTHRCQGDRPV